VMLMVVIHRCAPPRAKAYTVAALGWMLAAATTTKDSLVGYAVAMLAASWSSSCSMASWRIRNFWTLPVTVIGKVFTNFQ
jgi:hypothetical protein